MSAITLQGRVAIVTGAGSGLGRAHALELARRGARVVVNDIGGAVDGSGLDAGPAQAVVAEILAAGGEAVADTHSVLDGEAVVQTAVDAFGSVDILVNNAGILRDKAFHNMTREMYDAALDVHLRGAVYVTMAAYRLMRARNHGRIVNTTSTAGLLGNFGQANYGSGKAGLYGLMRVLALEGASNNVKVNCIAPIAYTRMSAGMHPEMRTTFTPERVSPVVAYLASDECAVTGEVFSVAGGHVARFFLGLTAGWHRDSGELTAEDVAGHLGEIFAEEGYTVPKTPGEEVMALCRKLIPEAAALRPRTPAPFDHAQIGRHHAVGRTAIGREAALEYAAATNDRNPCYAASDLIPPVFAVVPTFEGILSVVRDVIPESVRSFTVHGSHDMHFHVPLRSAMAIDTTSEAVGYRVKGSGTTLWVKLTSVDDAGRVVLEQYSSFVIRGVQDSTDGGIEGPAHAFPDDARSRPIATRKVHVDDDQTYRYAKASGDNAFIHLDAEAARKVGLPGIIVHGLCTMAMCSSMVIDAVAQGDPARLARLAVKFSGNLLPGVDLVTDMYDAGGTPSGRFIAFEAQGNGTAVIRNGWAEIRPA
ncbi:MAG: SDR family NAD(P)-dependent oxidoreductase [Gammaproteobacteria bacterium]